MKLKGQIVGLPVFSIAEVESLGQVVDLLINPDSGAVEYLVIEPEKRYLAHRIIPFEEISGIGDDVLTIQTKEHVAEISSVPQALELLGKSVILIGVRVMKRKGQLQGTIDELLVDETSGRIIACRWQDQGTIGYIANSSIITFGKEFLVVEDEFQVLSLESIPQIGKQPAVSQSPVNNASVNTVKEQSTAEPETKSLVVSIEQKRKQNLIGRMVTSNIFSEEGFIIAGQGDRVTQEIIERAVNADRYVELTLNTRD